MKPTLGQQKKFQHLTKAEEVVITRRIGHTKATPISCPEDHWLLVTMVVKHWALTICSWSVQFCLFVLLLSHFWLIHLFYLHLLYQPYVGLCQATRVQSHQRQSTSAVAIAICVVQVSAADYQTVPTVATGVSKPLCCRLTLTFTLTSENLSLYITLLL